MKIQNDKYYTPIEVANYCIDKTLEIIGLENISETIEPSCGNGSFCHNQKLIPNILVDIEPLIENAIRTDYLTYSLPYKEGRLIIGNPPFGEHMNMAQKFFKKSIQIADYIAFILPISQLNNTNSLFEFDLIYSEDLGVKHYTDRDLHCCFNIYKRPFNRKLNKRESNKLKDVSIYRQDSNGYNEKEYDLRMCYWGDGTAGKILNESEHYSAEYKIKIHNENLKDEIIGVLSKFDWKGYLNCIAMRKIQQFHIIKVLKDNVKGIS